MSNNLTSGLSLILVGILIIILNIPLAKRKIKMNRWYGVRIPKSFESDENWYKLNEYGKLFINWAIPIILAGIIVLFLPPFSEKGTITTLSLLVFLVIMPLIQILIYSRKI